MKTADEFRREIRNIIEANRREYVARRIADVMGDRLALRPVHPDALRRAS